MVEPLDEGKVPQEARDELPEGEENAEPRTFRSLRPPKPLDEDMLDELAARIATMPEPVATLAVGVEIARAEGDATGVRKRLFELGIGIVRYGFSLGLAALVAKLGGAAAPRPLAEALARAARISDGMWCELTRTIGNALKPYDPALAQMLAFTSQRPLTELVSARNDFIHRGGSGDNALEKLMALLENTEALLSLSLRCVVSLDPLTYEARMGTPLRGGVWRKTKGALAAGVEAGVAYVVREDGTWMPVSPYLPLVDKRLLFADGPHAPGKPWRCTDPEIGEHREHQPVDRAIRKLVGEDKNAPQELTDRPRLVGRDAAVKSLERAAEEAASGSVRMALVTGSFGVGRTRVADEIVAAAAAYGFGRVIDARCSVERRTPLRALRTAIEGVKGLGRMRDAIERALSVEAAMTRAALEASIEAIEEALVEASLEEPTVLDMDDAQWADEHTQGLLRMLTDRAIRKGRGRLFVIVTVRDEPNPSVALRRFVGRVEQGIGAGATRVMLDALSSKDASALVQNVAPIAKDIERAVVEGAGGVPFFLVQPLLVWNETGALVWRDAAWRPRDESILRASVPGVRDLLRARLDSFFDPGSDGERAAQHVLACVALYGSGLPVEQLVAAVEAAGTNARSVEQALELLVESGLLIVRGERQEYGFAQEIVRQAALEDVRQKPWFRRIHRSLLEAVGRSEVAEENAAFLAAGHESLGDREEAARWYSRAVAKALAGGEFERAMELAEKLAQVAKGAERARAELHVGDALFRAGRAAEAKERLEKIHLDGVTDMGVRLEARTLTLAIAAILRHLPADHDPTLVADADAHGDMALRVETRLAVARLSRGHRGLSLAEAAIGLAAACPLELRYRALGMRLELLAEVDPSDVVRLQRATELVRTAARELGSPWAELDADNAFACARSNAGDFATALPLFESISERAKRFKFGTLEREVLVNTATTYLRTGDAARAANAANRAAETCRAAGDLVMLAGALSVCADGLLRIGELARARAAIDEAIEIILPGRDYRATLALLRRVEICEQSHDEEQAAKDATTARVIALENGNVDHAARAVLWLALHAARCADPGARDELQKAVESASQVEASLRPPTRRLVDAARKLLAAS
ncbi:ATP-binding protein [Polyangium mundeleinium]|uniref:AAA family ATPase n=1 Tax=Polyangium mundeleinium TaxID=2995306 RepID=A0ABT5EEE1_9BACT|nr:AAA family ATPase [Polyangium mundeleinium]MDC0740179.1 AAA family ATPase [Polyangium mundeleinium]